MRKNRFVLVNKVVDTCLMETQISGRLLQLCRSAKSHLCYDVIVTQA